LLVLLTFEFVSAKFLVSPTGRVCVTVTDRAIDFYVYTLGAGGAGGLV
jgi:hypothetical protein